MANIVFNNYTPPVKEKKEKYSITIAIFFDGTKNNKNNSNARDSKNSHYESYKKYGTDSDSSYQNDWSNVARLWENYSDTENKIYVEGIGTTDYKDDSTRGYALGAGVTGIRHKVRKGCEQVANKIKSKINSNNHKTLQKITLNVYGFSRGAAAARNFVYEIGKASYKARKRIIDDYIFYYDADDFPSAETLPSGGHLGNSLLQSGIKLDTNIIEVNFLGIFDTVSSYSTSLLPSFSNDIAELSLNSLAKAKNVVHLTAVDEMRENFSLTRSPKGIEKNLPGVHSDIGGSYLTGKEIVEEIETSWTVKSKLEKLQNNLIKDGWYKPGELSITGGNFYWALRGEKAIVYKEYSYIPLQFMADFSNDYNAIINYNILSSKYSIENHPILKKAKQELEGYVRNNQENPYDLNRINSDNLGDLKKLRYAYFHRSARRNGIGMDPNSNWKRKELNP